jgi:hypothetical protein
MKAHPEKGLVKVWSEEVDDKGLAKGGSNEGLAREG